MKKIYSFLAGILLASTTMAQLAPGSYAPDFTVTDINGNSHNLYTYLNAGKTVIMDISAVWCAPCWNYHTSGALETFYTAHGPNGDNTAMVLFVEGDQGTLAQLNGGTGSKGNWVTGTEYPIIMTTPETNGSGIPTSYQVGYFPTVYMICPDRVVTEIGQLTATQLEQAVGQCPALSTTNIDAKIFSTASPKSTIYCSQASVIPIIKLQNYGNTALTSANVEVTIGDSTYAPYNWTGNLAKYEVAQVSLPAINGVENGILDYSIKVLNPNGSTDENTNNNESTGTFAKFAGTNSVSFAVTVDDYPAESSFEISKDGKTFYVKDGFTANTTITSCLETGCYTLKVKDSYGDGGATVTVKQGSTNVASSQVTAFESTANFCVTPVGIEFENADNTTLIYPNPTQGILNIENAENSDITILNILGEIVANYNCDNSKYQINMNSLENGNYIVKIVNSKGVMVEKITLTK